MSTTPSPTLILDCIYQQTTYSELPVLIYRFYGSIEDFI